MLPKYQPQTLGRLRLGWRMVAPFGHWADRRCIPNSAGIETNYHDARACVCVRVAGRLAHFIYLI